MRVILGPAFRIGSRPLYDKRNPYELDKLPEVLKQAYWARLEKEFEIDRGRIQKIAVFATGSRSIGLLGHCVSRTTK